MSKAVDVEVLIGDKQYTVSGEEGSEYIQKIAVHINDKLAEFRQQAGYDFLDEEMKNVLLAINLSDDYYKAVQELQEAKSECQDKEREIFDMKHELVTMQTKMDKLVEESNQLKEQQDEEEHSAIRMEAKYEHASRNEEKSRLELTRLEKRLKLIQDSEQRAQTKQKELEKELEEQKKLVEKLSSHISPEDLETIQAEGQKAGSVQKAEEQKTTGNAVIDTMDASNAIIDAVSEETVHKEADEKQTDGKAAGARKTQGKKSSRKSRRR